MTTIDWNDPDFCAKYRYRNGMAIAEVHTVPPSMAKDVVFPHFTKPLNRDWTKTHKPNGHFLSVDEEHDFDIVPVPREPRRGEGYGWESLTGVGLVISASPHQVFPHGGVFKIKWEEVIE